MKLFHCVFPECNFVFEATENLTPKLYCPYCGREQIKRSEMFLKYERLMQEDLLRHKGGCYNSCTDDYSYYYGMIDALWMCKVITQEETTLLHELKEKFTPYRKNVVE